MVPNATASYQNNGKTGAGTYEVTAMVGRPNYKDMVLTATMEIGKAASVITADPTQIFTYDGAWQNVVAVLNHSETTVGIHSGAGLYRVGEHKITVKAVETNYCRWHSVGL
tara:strand:+ start:450 stop:782 length:333 start_codon:yes stop_codon:yes gene_type:complete